jgi:4-hydroxy-tetrahydrodipicolinate synthase
LPTVVGEAGGHSQSSGASCISANFYPHILAWLCDNFNKADPGKVEAVQRFLTVADAVIKVNYPASAKVYLKEKCGVNIGPFVRAASAFPATPGPEREELMLRFDALHKWAEEVATDCGAIPAHLTARAGAGAAAGA